MFYHVVIEEKNKNSNSYGEHKTDLTKEQLLARFVEPYDYGKPITLNGKTIDLENIDRFTVKATDNPIEQYALEIKHRRRNSDFVFIGGPSDVEQAVIDAKDVSDDFITGPAGSKKELTATRKPLNDRSYDHSKVFIVHGHDVAAKTKAARFVERLGFEAVILHEQISSGRTIIEKIEELTQVGFAIVLYTPDDVGNAKGLSENLKLRARQNVIFEHGYLTGKLGREKVIALVDGDMELPNDISGVVFTKMDEADAWHLSVAREMKHAGFTIDMNKLI
jgi:predicted nucleotide-binding protein